MKKRISPLRPSLHLFKLVRDLYQTRGIITLHPEVTVYKPQLEDYICQLEEEDKPQNPSVYGHVFQTCSKLKALVEGRRIHAHILRTGVQVNTVLYNHIISMYAKCGSPDDARKVFERTPRANVFSWTAVIAAYAINGHFSEALRLFRSMLLNGVKPDRVVFITVLEALSCHESLLSGRMIHMMVLESGMQLDVVTLTALVDMYGKCGSADLAQNTFEHMKEWSVVTWTTIISANSRNDRQFQALQMFSRMQLEGARPNMITLVAAAEACDSPKFLAQGRLVEKCLMETGVDRVAERTLISMFGKCRSLEDARRTFDKIKVKNVVCWSAMVLNYTDSGLSADAFQLYFLMQLEGVRPDCMTLVMLLNACEEPEHLMRGKMLHALLMDSQHELCADLFLQNSLISMYGECGDAESAAAVFENVEKRDSICWNSMLQALANYGDVSGTLALWRQMLQSGTKHSTATFMAVLSICEDLISVRSVHCCMRDLGLEKDSHVGTATVIAYSKCGSLEDAECIFSNITNKNVASYNALIAAYTQSGQFKQAMQVFKVMQLEGFQPNKGTLRTALEACSTVAGLAEGWKLHRLIDQQLGIKSLRNSLVLMYGKCGQLDDAWDAFKMIPLPDVVSWTVLAESYAQNGQGSKAVSMFWKMQQEGNRPNDASVTSALSACSHAGLVGEGMQVFRSLLAGDFAGLRTSALHFGCVVDLLGRAGQLELAEEFVLGVPAGIGAPVMWTSLLSACNCHGDVERGKRVAKRLEQWNLVVPETGSYLLLSNMLTGGHS